jgi:hypothetical protein
MFDRHIASPPGAGSYLDQPVESWPESVKDDHWIARSPNPYSRESRSRIRLTAKGDTIVSTVLTTPYPLIKHKGRMVPLGRLVFARYLEINKPTETLNPAERLHQGCAVKGCLNPLHKYAAMPKSRLYVHDGDTAMLPPPPVAPCNSPELELEDCTSEVRRILAFEGRRPMSKLVRHPDLQFYTHDLIRLVLNTEECADLIDI